MRGSLYVDRTGVFGGDLIAVTTAGEVWRITSAGVPTLLADVNTHLEGVNVVPNDPVRYGPLAGQILAGAENQGRMYAIDAAGDVDFYTFGVAIEDIDLIPANENFFGVNFGSSKLLGAPASAFSSMVGDILLTQEIPRRRGFRALPPLLGRHRPAHPATGCRQPARPRSRSGSTSPSRRRASSRSRPDRASRACPTGPSTSTSTTTVAATRRSRPPSLTSNGGYQFSNLAPGTYVVAEEPQPNWDQTAPVTRTWTVTVSRHSGEGQGLRQPHARRREPRARAARQPAAGRQRQRDPPVHRRGGRPRRRHPHLLPGPAPRRHGPRPGPRHARLVPHFRPGRHAHVHGHRQRRPRRFRHAHVQRGRGGRRLQPRPDHRHHARHDRPARDGLHLPGRGARPRGRRRGLRPHRRPGGDDHRRDERPDHLDARRGRPRRPRRHRARRRRSRRLRRRRPTRSR